MVGPLVRVTTSDRYRGAELPSSGRLTLAHTITLAWEKGPPLRARVPAGQCSVTPAPAGTPRTPGPSAVSVPRFVPSVKGVYPSGINQDISQQKGTFVEVKGYGEQMEGRSRPTLF